MTTENRNAIKTKDCIYKKDRPPMKFHLVLADLAQLGERQTEEKTLVKISGGPVFDPQSSHFYFFPVTQFLDC